MVATKLTTTQLGRYGEVILTTGMVDASTGRRGYGVFASEADARSEHADELALATISADELTSQQIADAERNSECL